LKGLNRNLKEQGVELIIKDNALNLLADLGFDPQFGARPLKRVIQKEVVNELAKLLLSNDLVKDESITLDTDAKGFTFNGKSTGIALHRDSDRKSQIDALTKATKDLEEASKKMKPDQPENLN